MKNILVAIVILRSNLENIAYALNSVLSQDYSNLSLLIIGNRTPNISMNKMLEVIESNKRENLHKIFINLSKDFYSIKEYSRYIYNYALNNKIEYLSILIDGDAFYQCDSLSQLMKHKNHNDAMIFGNSIIYNKQGNYLAEYTYIGKTDSLSIKQVFQHGMGFKINCENELRLGGILYLPFLDGAYELKEKSSKIRYISEIPVLRFQEENDTHMNYTNNYFLMKCADILYKRRFSNEEVNIIEKTINYIFRNGSRVGECDLNLVRGLFELLEINKSYFRKKRLKNLYSIRRPLSIKIVFFCQQFSTWSSLQSIYKSAIEDPRFEVSMVYIPFKHFNSDIHKVDIGFENYIAAGYPIINYYQYNLERDSPDIAIFVSPYSYVPKGFDIEEIQKNVRRCIYVPYGFMMESSIPELMRLRYRLPMQLLAWKVLFDDDFGVNFAKKNTFTNGENFIAIGNPRIDFINMLPLEEDEEYINDIQMKARGRKIILWNTHHSINETSNTFSSWKKYGNTILKYFSEHKEYYLLWRPHPLFRKALERYIGENHTKVFFENVQKMENVLIDEYKSYSAGFSVSDLFLSDPSSLVKEFIFTGKPIILTTMSMETIINEEIKACLYIPSNETELYNFLDSILMGLDPKQLLRKAYKKTYNIYGEGTVGDYILNYIYENLNNELENLKLY